MKFKSKQQNILLTQGQDIDEKSRKFIREALGLTNKKVEATRHTILSGPPGVGKTYGTTDECRIGNVKSILIPPGTTDIDLITRIAVAVYKLKANEELVVILDDADDVVFSDYKTLNKWKIAMQDNEPMLNHPVSVNNTIRTLEKQVEAGNTAKQIIIDALMSFQAADSLGISVPTDKVRFFILCNLDLEDPKAFSRNAKLKSAVDPVLDRFAYKRIDLDWERQWAWLAYVLSQTQPFSEQGYDLTDDQKTELLQWMYSNWNNLRSTSYRTVRKLAEAMINDPEEYIDQWHNQLKGH